MVNLPGKRPRRYLSLRWKALIGLSVVLIAVNASLAFFSYSQLTDQFERQQASVRDRQGKQLKALLDDRYQQMSRLANVVPLLAQARAQETLAEHLQRALNTNGVMLDLEWDIRSVHWIKPDGDVDLLWPLDAAALPKTLSGRIKRSPEETARTLSCAEECRQFLAAPLLWHGESSGALVLGRSLADALLAFNTLTGAEAAIILGTAPSNSTRPPTPNSVPLSIDQETQFKAITHAKVTRSLFLRALGAEADTGSTLTNGISTGEGNTNDNGDENQKQSGADTVLIDEGDDWHEVFRLRALAPGIDALVLNNVTRQRHAIRAATRESILIGTIGLILSGILVLLIMRTPLSRLRRLADLLPLLADHRFSELRERLPRKSRRWPLRDEMHLMVDTVHTLSGRMEGMEQDREQARKELVWLADHDPLTLLLNRRRFNHELVHLVQAAAESGGCGALLFVDLDQFKDVNDISGHQMGDGLLQSVAKQLAHSTAGRGILGRLGGDEFAIILPGANSDHATAMAEDIQKRVQEVVIHSRAWRHQVSASIGIVLFPTHGIDTQQLMADADLAMYQAKERGRGRWHIFSPEDTGRERANARVLWAERINAALRDNRFELHLQPILNMATGEVRRAEALLRMRGPDGQLVLPDSFIPIAEETGQIEAIDHWVLAHAIDLMQHHADLSLSVNLSANALQDPSLRPDVERLLSVHGVLASQLTLEITETVAIGSLRSATRLMHDIRAIGCRFALDDFGSGFASYAYLRELPVDDVKIDGAFIRNIAVSKEDQIFVRAVTEMAHGMGKTVVAEFVENEEVLGVLADIGVDFAQGYHIGRPAPPKNEPLGSTRPERNPGPVAGD